MPLILYFARNSSEIWHLTLGHFLLVALATGAATLIGVPIGILLTRRPKLTRPVLAFANIVQTIPSLALFGFLIPILGEYGIGRLPAIIALFLYSLLPIIQNTYTGISGIDPSVREAGKGMGMTDWQLLTQVDLPLSTGVVLAGIRVATVISVGTATIAAAIGAGGLGVLIFRGLRMNDDILILAGAVPAAIMAIAADFSIGLLERGLFPSRRGKDPQASAAPGKVKGQVAVFSFIALAAALIALSWAGFRSPQSGAPQITVGSKDFTEQVILGELLAQVIETKTGLRVKRDFELSGGLCHRALVSGDIDGYVEYSGTAYTDILKHKPVSDPKIVYETVKREYANRWNAVWFPPLGFNNTFAILVRDSTARRLNLHDISDIRPYAQGWRVAFGQDFMSRKDGYQGFVKAYGLQFKGIPAEMDLALTYRALASGQVDLIAGNSTDGQIKQLDLAQLADDLHYFPPYEAAPVFRGETLNRYPALRAALESLAGRITTSEMRKMNYEVDAEHKSVGDVVAEFLRNERR